LTLDLGAHSPTDSKHWFRNYLASDEEDSTTVQKTDYSWYDPLHGWVNGKQVQYPPESVIRRQRLLPKRQSILGLGKFAVSSPDIETPTAYDEPTGD
jgi:hypothetical protein